MSAIDIGALALHDAVDALTDAWTAMATAVGRRREGWTEDQIVREAQENVRTATLEAETLLRQAIGGGE